MEQEKRRAFYNTVLVIVGHALLTVLATVSLLVALSQLPLVYCALCLQAIACVWLNLGCAYEASQSPEGHSVTAKGLLLTVFSVAMKICMLLMLAIALPSVDNTEAMKGDALISTLRSLLGEQLSTKFGHVAISIAGVNFCLRHDLSKLPEMSEKTNTMTPLYKKFVSSTLSFVFSCALLCAIQIPHSSMLALPSFSLVFSQMLWICIFSLTARAALSMSYDDGDFDPLHGRMMGLVGLMYCFLVD